MKIQNTLFENKHLRFKKRFLAAVIYEIFGLVLIFSTLVIAWFIEANVVVPILGFIFCVIYLPLFYYQSKDDVSKIEFENNYIIFTRSYHDKTWLDKYEINDVTIEIKEYLRKHRIANEFRVVFRIGQTKLTVNKLFNWNNFELYNLFITFKERKGEKSTIDDRFLLEGLIKKAKSTGEWNKK